MVRDQVEIHQRQQITRSPEPGSQPALSEVLSWRTLYHGDYLPGTRSSEPNEDGNGEEDLEELGNFIDAIWMS
jgi:hypothetical protein